MARPDQEAIDTFMSITGVDEATAITKLEEHLGNLNEAVNAHFNGNGNIHQEAAVTSTRDDVMNIDDPIPFEPLRPPSSLLPFGRDLNPFSILDPNFRRSIFDIGNPATRSPFVSHPREVREIPIEVKDEIGVSGRSSGAPTIEDVTETMHEHGPEIRGTVIIDDEDDERDFPNSPIRRIFGGSSANYGSNVPTTVDVPDYGNDIEEEMIRAAIEASKQEAATNQQYSEPIDLTDPTPQAVHTHPEDEQLARAVSLSLQTAEKEKALREGKAGSSEVGQKQAVSEEMGRLPSHGNQSRLEVGNTSFQDEAEEVEELPLVRHRRRRVSSDPIDTEEIEFSPPSSPQQHENVYHSQRDGSNFPSEEWGGISSEEHDEAVMLEAAMFGGIPEGGAHHVPYESHQLMQNGLGTNPWRMPRPPSPSLTAQRLIREQQNDEYLASLQADREKELKAKEAAEAALAEERRKEDELRRKQQEEQETERQLAAKEASLPQEPTPDNENAITLLVRMPDGNRRGRRFLKSDKLQYLFDFIDVGRVVKPGTYRLVRPYPRRAFTDVESASTLHELGLTSKQEALYLEPL